MFDDPITVSGRGIDECVAVNNQYCRNKLNEIDIVLPGFCFFRK